MALWFCEARASTHFPSCHSHTWLQTFVHISVKTQNVVFSLFSKLYPLEPVTIFIVLLYRQSKHKKKHFYPKKHYTLFLQRCFLRGHFYIISKWLWVFVRVCVTSVSTFFLSFLNRSWPLNGQTLWGQRSSAFSWTATPTPLLFNFCSFKLPGLLHPHSPPPQQQPPPDPTPHLSSTMSDDYGQLGMIRLVCAELWIQNTCKATIRTSHNHFDYFSISD